jgi:hypothetical protein
MAVTEEQFPDLQDSIEELDKNPDANEGVRIYQTFKNKKHLDEFTNDGPLDWAQFPRGPHFHNMGQFAYEACKDVLNEGRLAVYMAADNNVAGLFQDKWCDLIAEQIY